MGEPISSPLMATPGKAQPLWTGAADSRFSLFRKLCLVADLICRSKAVSGNIMREIETGPRAESQTKCHN